MRYALPQPFEDLGHVADVGVAVEGSTAEEALARLVLAYAALLTGGECVEVRGDERLAVQGEGRTGVAVALLRELLFRFATARVVPGECEVVRLDDLGCEVVVGLGRYDPERHAEGLDLKAVTWHAARMEESGGLWRGQIVFDI
ncbi:MAG: archease [Anaeromyxobacteraceae bacterium]